LYVFRFQDIGQHPESMFPCQNLIE